MVRIQDKLSKLSIQAIKSNAKEGILRLSKREEETKKTIKVNITPLYET